MDTTITLAGNLADEPELQHTRDGLPFAFLRVMVKRRTLNEAGAWTDAEPTAHKGRVFGTSATLAHDCLGRGDKVVFFGNLKTYAWLDKDGEKRTCAVVDVNHRFGEVGAWLRRTAVRIEDAPALAAGAR